MNSRSLGATQRKVPRLNGRCQRDARMDTESGFQFAHTLSGGGIIMQKRPSLVSEARPFRPRRRRMRSPPAEGTGGSVRQIGNRPSVRMNGRWPAKTRSGPPVPNSPKMCCCGSKEIDGVSDKAENASIWHALLSNVWLQLKGGGGGGGRGGVGEEPPTQWRNKEEEAEPVWGQPEKEH